MGRGFAKLNQPFMHDSDPDDLGDVHYSLFEGYNFDKKQANQIAQFPTTFLRNTTISRLDRESLRRVL